MGVFVADADGRIFAFVVAGFLIAFGLLSLWLARRTPRTAAVTPFPERAALSEQRRHYRNAFWVGAGGFLVLTIYTAYNLHQLESGAVEGAMLWQPLIPIYKRFGFWPTVCFPPALGIVCCGNVWLKMRRCMARDRQGERDGPATPP